MMDNKSKKDLESSTSAFRPMFYIVCGIKSYDS